MSAVEGEVDVKLFMVEVRLGPKAVTSRAELPQSSNVLGRSRRLVSIAT